MIAWLAALIAPTIGERFARAAAWGLVALFAIGLVLTVKAIYDRSVITDWTQEAEAEFEEALGQAETAAQEESAARAEEHHNRVRTTEELIDEAVAKGCAVGEYLASGGSRCL